MAEEQFSLDELKEKAYKANRDFFGQDVDVKFNFLTTREEMDQIIGRKTPTWVVGTTRNGKVNIFSPDVYDKVSDHHISGFPYTLTHEVAHVFTGKLYGFKSPSWLTEGLAGYVAGQYKIQKIRREQLQDFQLLHTFDSWLKNPNYPQAFSFTAHLIERFGKEAFLEFYKCLREYDLYNHFLYKFRENFGVDFDQFKDLWIKELDSQN